MSGRNAQRPPTTTSSGLVGRPLRGGRGGRPAQPGRPYAPSRQRFEGETEALKGHIYDLIGSKSADLFITTTKQIAGYVGRTYTQGGDIRLAIENLALPTLEGPTAPTPTDALAVAIFREEVREFVKRTKKLEENVQLLWALLWGQASDAVRTKLEARRDYEDMRQRSAGVELLNAIKDLMYNVQELKYIPLAIHLARRHFYSSFQQRHVDVAHYLEQFNNRVDILERCGAAPGEDPGTMRKVFEQEGIDPLTTDEGELQQVRNSAREWYLALAFLMGADRTRFGRLLEAYENDFTQGVDRYPRTRTDAFNILANYKEDERNYLRVTRSNDGVAFTTCDESNSHYEPQDSDGPPNEEPSTTSDLTTSTNPQQHGSTLVTARGGRGQHPGRGSGGRGRGHGHPITCFRCGETGHYASACPYSLEEAQRRLATAQSSNTNDDVDTAEQLFMSGSTYGYQGDHEDTDTAYQFLVSSNMTSSNTRHGAHIPKEWILLDSQSTVSIFSNRRLLRNIRKANGWMHIHCNAGITRTNLVGDLCGYGTVWYHPDGIANILSLAEVRKRFHVTYDSSQQNEFVVHKPDGTTKRFVQSHRGLFYLDTSTEGTTLVTTVDDNKSKYTNTDYSRAELARRIQRMIGRPSTRDFLHFVDNNLIPNCPITRDDILAAEHIFGPDLGSLKGKTVRRKPRPVKVHMTNIPATIMARYRRVTLAADVMYVNKLPFFISIARDIKFSTAQKLDSQKAPMLLDAVKKIQQVYLRRGFEIAHLLMDGQFEPIRGDLSSLGITLNTVANDEHVPEVERHIRTLKERTRATYNMLPFKQMPSRLIIEMVYAANLWLNMFPHANGISQTMSPRAIVTGHRIEYATHCQLEFGEYVQTHEEHDNSMQPRTIGALSLRPTGNVQGGYFFFSLTTGRVLNRNRWTRLPMPNEVIDRVHRMARQEKANRSLIFQNRNREVLADQDEDDDDESYSPTVTDEPTEHELLDPVDSDDDGADIQGVDIPAELEPNMIGDGAPPTGGHMGPEQIEVANNTTVLPMEQDGAIPTTVPVPETIDEPQDASEGISTPRLVPAPIPPGTERELRRLEINNEVPPLTRGRTRLQSQQLNLTTIGDPPIPVKHMTPFERELFTRRIKGVHLPASPTTLDHTILTQYTLTNGLQVFGAPGKEAVFREMQQLHQRKVCEPRKATDLSAEQRKASLGYLMFLKQKRSGLIKGRGCADGRKQRVHTGKEEKTSPTVATESVMLTSTIDAREGRDVATVDIPGAFMHSDQDETVHLRLQGTLADLLVKCDPKLYRKYVVSEGGQPVLYVELLKALYGTLRAALLFWRRLSKKLVDWGFSINPYDWCVANKLIQGSQCTIVWHIDDLKISHTDPKAVDQVIELLRDEFGQEGPLTVTRGKIHDYLGMTLDFSIPQKVQIHMYEFIEKMLADLPPDMDGMARTPAADHLFAVNPTPKPLPEETAILFHHNVAKLLFLCKRARPDLQTAVAFLCT